MPDNRLGLTFHRTFPLVRQAVSEIASVLLSDKKEIGRRNFQKETNLGSIYIEAMPRYAMGSGLLDDLNTLSPFGKSALTYDPLFGMVMTQWLMHYHLSAPLGPGPLFWHELVKTRFRSGDAFSTQEIAEQIGAIFEREEGKPLAERSARSTANIFLATYSRSDALGNLGLLKEVESGRFQVMDPDPPSTWVIGLALLHWWGSLYPKQVTINLNDLYGDQGFTNLLMIGKGRLNTALEELQDEGFVELYRIAPPYQVVLLRRDEEALLRLVYGH